MSDSLFIKPDFISILFYFDKSSGFVHITIAIIFIYIALIIIVKKDYVLIQRVIEIATQ